MTFGVPVALVLSLFVLIDLRRASNCRRELHTIRGAVVIPGVVAVVLELLHVGVSLVPFGAVVLPSAAGVVVLALLRPRLGGFTWDRFYVAIIALSLIGALAIELSTSAIDTPPAFRMAIIFAYLAGAPSFVSLAAVFVVGAAHAGVRFVAIGHLSKRVCR